MKMQIELRVVRHGYQLDIKNFSLATPDGQGVQVSGGCQDFAGSYDPVLVCMAAEHAITKAMRDLEKNYKRVLSPPVKHRVTIYIKGAVVQNIYGARVDSLKKSGIKKLTNFKPGWANCWPVKIVIARHVKAISGKLAKWEDVEEVKYEDLKEDQLEWKRLPQHKK